MKTNEIIIELRKKAGYKSQSKFAKAIGINPNTLSNYENGTHNVNYEWLLTFADFFDVSVDYLMGRVEHNTNFANEPFIENLNLRVTKGEFIRKADNLSPENKAMVYKIVDAFEGK